MVYPAQPFAIFFIGCFCCRCIGLDFLQLDIQREQIFSNLRFHLFR